VDLVDLRLDFIAEVVRWIVFFNFALAVFNLLPIPPLDGYNAALGVLPPRYAYTLQRYEQYGFLVLLALILLSYGPVAGPIDWIFAIAGFATDIVTGLGA
jgi:Zn-dependent protease